MTVLWDAWFWDKNRNLGIESVELSRYHDVGWSHGDGIVTAECIAVIILFNWEDK